MKYFILIITFILTSNVYAKNINITVNPINASFIDTSPLAIGLFFVLSTLASISLSHKSLTTQPALLIKIAPIVNRRINFKECIIEID